MTKESTSSYVRIPWGAFRILQEIVVSSLENDKEAIVLMIQSILEVRKWVSRLFEFEMKWR